MICLSNSDTSNPVITNAGNIEITNKYRNFRGSISTGLWKLILALIPIAGILYILGIHQYLRLSIYTEQYVGLFLGLILCGIFLGVPASKRAAQDRVPWYDWILSVLGLNSGLYVMFFYPEIIFNFAYVTPTRIILSVVAILLILEGIRRIIGKGMLIIVLLFISYGFFAPYLPGIFKGRDTDISQLVNYLYLDPNSLLTLLGLAGTIGVSFLLFGQILLFFGGGDIINNLALASLGRYRGGPAKSAVVGSSLAGTLTGGPVTNVLLTGTITIPLMKKSGYTSIEAGAVEAVSSTGGQIMPPVMGIAAFIIAETLGIPYAEVALAALVPAMLFYICLFIQVDLIAARKGLHGMSKEAIPSLINTLKTGWLIIPSVGSLIYLLFFQGYTPQVAGLYASVIALVFLSFQTGMWKNIFRLLQNAFVDTGRLMLEISIVLAAAGFVIGVTGITGLGFNLAKILAQFGQFGLFPLLLVCAIASIILGMGMPSVAAYSLVAVLVAPAIVKLGVDPLAAHLFVFYFSVISNFTPPIALSCFAAAPIAGADPYRIGFNAMKLGVVAYLIPFIFVYAPELLIGTERTIEWGKAIISISTAIMGCYFMAVVLGGFMMQHIGVMKRIFAAFLTLGLLLPGSVWGVGWVVDLVAIILAVLFIFYEWRRNVSQSNEGDISRTAIAKN
jgi:TRAP transporter 4TM/12TM fusion protein